MVYTNVSQYFIAHVPIKVIKIRLATHYYSKQKSNNICSVIHGIYNNNKSKTIKM